jgi:hypothetical protein
MRLSVHPIKASAPWSGLDITFFAQFGRDVLHAPRLIVEYRSQKHIAVLVFLALGLMHLIWCINGQDIQPNRYK